MSFDAPKITHPILSDVATQNAINQALAKMDVSLFQGLQDGTKRIVEGASATEIKIQELRSGSWEDITSIDISAKKVGGFGVSQTAQANTVAVRNAQGALAGDILGNAQTANNAQALTAVNPIAMGGTNANTAAGARSNLGVASQVDLEILEGLIDGAIDSGQIGQAPLIPSGADLNTYTNVGDYWCATGGVATTVLNRPDATNWSFTLSVKKHWTNEGVFQILYRQDNTVWTRTAAFDFTADNWTDWELLNNPAEVTYAIANGQIGDIKVLPSGTDINTVIETGSYSIYDAVNSPFLRGIFLDVRDTGGQIVQEVTSYGLSSQTDIPNKLIRKRNTSNVWSEWGDLSTPAEVTYAIANGQIGEGIPSLGSTNITTIKRNGDWLVATSAGNTGVPTGEISGVLSVKIYSGTNGSALWLSRTTGKIFLAVISAGNWFTWVQINSSPATESVAGTVVRATNADASAGTNTTEYVTPYQLKTYHRDITASGKATDGSWWWVQFSNGLIMQGGTVYNHSVSPVRINYPKAFTVYSSALSRPTVHATIGTSSTASLPTVRIGDGSTTYTDIHFTPTNAGITFWTATGF